MKPGCVRKNGANASEESGFALLLVFVLAAGIAIGMYMELPRVAFESQRMREQMAIDRGMQYAHAIQLFQRKFGAFPQNLDDLETKRNIRFLRHRYLDPLTGKEYRLIHVGPAGMLTDSLVQPQSAANLIQQILTSPRQPPSSVGGFTSGNTGGIAGVASTAEGKGIHVVNDHNKYKEWEFVYDLKKDKTVVGAAAVNAQQNVQQQMQQNQNGNNGAFGSSPFGNNSPGSSPFSSSPTNSPGPVAAPTIPTTPPPTQ